VTENDLIAQLNADFALQREDQRLRFVASAAGLPFIELWNHNACATLSLQGAQLLSWQPSGETDMLWLSNRAVFAPGKAIRGGIPVCWPWFGEHASQPQYPAHGFARTAQWQVMGTHALGNGDTLVDLRLDTRRLDADVQILWSTPTLLDYRLTIGRTLSLSLTTTNVAPEPITLSQALHTYFAVTDIRHTTITGLDGHDYLDKTDAFARKSQRGDVSIDGEIDRLYLQSVEPVILTDGRRRIRIDKSGSHTTVVWNPWQAGAGRLADMDDDGYRHMVCIEAANAADDSITLDGNDCHTLAVSYTLV
jgi:D-hexose-6-phosphate mutarotase